MRHLFYTRMDTSVAAHGRRSSLLVNVPSAVRDVCILRGYRVISIISYVVAVDMYNVIAVNNHTYEIII